MILSLGEIYDCVPLYTIRVLHKYHRWKSHLLSLVKLRLQDLAMVLHALDILSPSRLLLGRDIDVPVREYIRVLVCGVHDWDVRWYFVLNWGSVRCAS